MSFSASIEELVEKSTSPLVAAAPTWVRVPLSKIAEILNGFPWKSSHFNDTQGEPVIRIRDVTSGKTETRYDGKIEDGYWIENGDLLVGMDGDFNTRVWDGGRALLNQRVCKITSDERFFLTQFLAKLLPGYLQLINDETHSITVKHLSSKTLADLPLPLAPLPEQRRIVAKIDNLSSKSKRAREQLDHVARLVEKYKQAVLAAGFWGDLTREWRAANAHQETPEQRLEKIRLERRSDSIRASKSQSPPNDDNGRVPVELGQLPASWAVATLEEITSPTRLIQYGILKPGPHIEGGVPYVKVMNIRGEKIELERIRCTTPEIAYQYRRAAITTGDILLTIRGTVGRIARVPEALDGGNITQDSVRIAPLSCMDADFVFLYLRTSAVQQYFSANQKGVAVRGINVGDVRPLEVPLPPTEEQHEIVRHLTVALAWIDRLAAEATNARKLIDHLDQAILAKAFRGDLVAQDPNDEPASVLLDRIRADRVVDEPKAKRQRKKAG